MNETLQEPLTVLCEEIGLAPPSLNASGLYVLEIDGHELRVIPLAKGRVVLAGLIGSVNALTEKRRQDRDRFLSHCLTVQAARLSKQAVREVLTWESGTDELLLWRSFEPFELSISSFLSATETLLNELEFWKNWSSIA